MLIEKARPNATGIESRVSSADLAGGQEITEVTPDGLFGLLSSVSCGAFVLATDQKVVFWNRRAREILGYTPDRIVGQRCSGLARGVGGSTLTADCEEGCLMVRNLRAGLVPGRARLRMRCASGERKWLVVTPMVVSGVEEGGPLLVYLFGDSGEETVSADVERLVELGGGAGRGSDYPHYVRPSAFLEDPRVEADSSDYDERVLGSSATEPSGEGGGSDDSGLLFRRARPRPREVNLTEREREVLSYLALGWETKYIAEELGVSWYTARNHIENLRTKLGASTRLEAVMVAIAARDTAVGMMGRGSVGT